MIRQRVTVYPSSRLPMFTFHHSYFITFNRETEIYIFFPNHLRINCRPDVALFLNTSVFIFPV